MTGFGKSVVELPSKKITVEIKSLNSKQLDVSMRVPSAYRGNELEIRNHVASRLERGKVDVVVYVETLVPDTVATLNLDLIARYKSQIEQMQQALGLPEPKDWYYTLLHFPDIYKTDTNHEVDKDEVASLLGAVDAAIEQLMEFRAQEGRKLEAFFEARIARISGLLAEVPQYETERVKKIRARIIDNLSRLHEVEYDRGRLEQEMIFYIEKLDINEEKQRLSQHLRYFMETIHEKARPRQEARVYLTGDGTRNQHPGLQKQPRRDAAPGGDDEGRA